jgi:hypothetical protein
VNGESANGLSVSTQDPSASSGTDLGLHPRPPAIILARIDPDHQVDHEAWSEPFRQLPPGKTAYDVWGDYLQQLIGAAKVAFQQERGIDWLDELDRDGKVLYVVGVPVAWCSEF